MSDTTHNTQLLIEAAKNGDTAEVKRLIPLSNPKSDGSLALHWALLNGHLGCIELLIPVSDDATQVSTGDLTLAAAYAARVQAFERQINAGLLIEAAGQGDTQQVVRLILVSDLKAGGNKALQAAAREGHAECVKLLIPLSNPKAKNNKALCEAATNGHAQCVALLVPVSEPNKNSMEMFWAVQRGDHEIVDLLFEISDSQSVLDELKKSHPNQPQRWEYLKEKIDVQQQKDLLMAEVGDIGGLKNQRKM